MNVLFVYVNQNTQSYGAALHNCALGFFSRRGDSCVISDLHASGFHPIAEKWDFKTSGGVHQNYMQEQRRVSGGGGEGFAEDIKDEIAKLRQADLVVFEFPFWWSSVPAMMKGYFDKVFALGTVWDSGHRYANGLLSGKQALVITTAGDSEEDYSAEGIHGATIQQHMYPLLHSTLAQAGMDVHNIYAATGLTLATDEECQKKLEGLSVHLQQLIDSPSFIYKH